VLGRAWLRQLGNPRKDVVLVDQHCAHSCILADLYRCRADLRVRA
jgi:hypothetical protein